MSLPVWLSPSVGTNGSPDKMPWDRELDTPGPAGPGGPPGAGPLPLDGDKGADSFIPGPPSTVPGPAGPPGPGGGGGLMIPLPIDGISGMDAFPIPGPRGAAGAGGTPSVYATGTFTTPTGNFVNMTKIIILTGAQRATLEGTAQLRIN